MQRKAKKPIQYIKDHPIAIGADNVAIEVIPFEHLLKMILQQLEQKVA